MVKKALLGILFVLTFFFSVSGTEAFSALEVRLGWKNSVDFSPYYLGQDMGFYKKQGLEVRFIPSEGSNLAVKLIAKGEQPLGIVSASTTLVAASKGMPLKVVAAIFQDSPACIFYRKNSGIKSLKDLEGKSIASNPHATKHLQFQILLKKNGIDPKKIKMVSCGFGGELRLFMKGEVDAGLYYLYDGVADLKKAGFNDFHYFMFRDYGIRLYDQSLVVNADFLSQNSELVGGFVNASLEAWRYAVKNPEKAIESLFKRVPEIDRKHQLTVLKEMLLLTQNKDGLGHMSEQRWKEMGQILAESGMIGSDFDVKSVYTIQFLK